MLSAPVGILIVVAALGVFAWVGVAARSAHEDVEDYVVARDTQSAGGLGLSFLASGLGAWILFAPPEVGARVGLLGVLGYTAAVIVPLLALGVLGRRVRAVMPLGHGLTEFVRVRFSGATHRYVIAVSLLYMLVAVTSELTAAGAVIGRLTGLDPRWVVLVIVVATLAYTAYGGLRASLRTDGWQAWLLIGLLAFVAVAVATGVEDPLGAVAGSDLLGLDATGLEAAVTLVIAIVVTTLFHNGYWQRVWAARDRDALSGGIAIGSLLRVLPILAVGFAGILAAGSGLELGDPPVPFFALVSGLSPAVLGVVVLLAVALVASSVDTLENGMAALVTTERQGTSLTGARVATVLLMIPATLAAFQGYSVLRILLIADLLCAATVVPVLLGLWSRATSSGAVAGSVAGLVGAALPALVSTGSVARALRSVTFPGASIDLPPFLGALVASSVVAVAVSLAAGRVTDVGEAGRRVGRLAPSDSQA